MTPIETRIRQANPIPQELVPIDEMAAAVILERVLSTPTERGAASDRQSVPTRLVVAVGAAAALIVCAVLGARLLRPADTVLVASQPLEVRLAHAYIEARNEYDPVAALALLNEDAELSEYPVVQHRSDLGPAFDYLRVIDERLDIVSCAPLPRSPGTVVCLYDMTNRLIEAVGSPPVTGRFMISSAHGHITAVTNEVSFDQYLPALERWSGWLAAQDEPVFEVLWWEFHLGDSVVTPRLDQVATLAVLIDRYHPTGAEPVIPSSPEGGSTRPFLDTPQEGPDDREDP